MHVNDVPVRIGACRGVEEDGYGADARVRGGKCGGGGKYAEVRQGSHFTAYDPPAKWEGVRDCCAGTQRDAWRRRKGWKGLAELGWCSGGGRSQGSKGGQAITGHDPPAVVESGKR